MDANDRWKNIEAQKQAKMEIKVDFKNACYTDSILIFACSKVVIEILVLHRVVF